jgi:hypothetical protein
MRPLFKNLDEKKIIRQKAKKQNISNIDGKRKFCFFLIFNVYVYEN